MSNAITYVRRSLTICVAILVSQLGGVDSADRAELFQSTNLIPRSVLFGNPERQAPELSPDGKYLAFLAPRDGVMNVWVAPVDDPGNAKPITNDTVRGIRIYFWAYDGKHLLYAQDQNGDENYHIYRTDVITGETTDLTPGDKIRAMIYSLNERTPNELLVGLNDRVPQLHDVYHIDLQTGERTLVEQNPGFAAYLIDHDNKARFALTFSPTGGQILLSRDQAGEWKPYLEIPNTDALSTRLSGFDKANAHAYLIDSRERNTSALFSLDLETGATKLLAEDSKADVAGIITHPTEKHVQAVSFNHTRTDWKILDADLQPDFDYLKSVESGDLNITSRTLDDRLWTVAFAPDNGPVKYYLFDRDARTADYLFSNRTDLDDYTLSPMTPVIIKSRDGLDLVSYLSLPPGSDGDGNARPDQPVPTVLLVHGGPWARDQWGFHPLHQWLANRGYAVLSVNYRGSVGFGKDFTNAGNGEWSLKMHNDLIDAVEWLVAEKIAPRDQIAIMGGSYGGYATLVGLTFTPEVFTCGVDIVGPSNLVTLLNNVPPYWVPILPMMKDRVGDWTTEEGRRDLMSKSPLSLVEKIQRPLLIGQGANDPRVNQVESDQIVNAMKEKNIPVTYVLYSDEGHGFARPENRLSFYAVTEAFLAEHLGGRFEPVGDDFEDSTIAVPEGADQVPGLNSALDASAS